MFFENVMDLLKLATDSFSEIRVLRQQKEESDHAHDILRKTMTGTIKRLQGQHKKGKAKTTVNSMFDTDETSVDDIGLLSSRRPSALSDVAGADKGSSDLVVAEHDPLDLGSGSHAHYNALLSVLQSMCEGNNKTIQDYFRRQPDNIKNFNLIAKVSKSLASFVQESPIREETVPMIAHSVAALTEFCQGNKQNQKNAFDFRVFDSINVLLLVEHGEILHEEGSAGKDTTSTKESSRDRVIESLFTSYSQGGYLAMKNEGGGGMEKLCQETEVLQYQLPFLSLQMWVDICQSVSADSDLGLSKDEFAMWCHSKFATGAAFTIDANGFAVHDPDVVQLHFSAAELLGRMLETNDADTLYLAQQINSMVQLPAIVRLFREYSALGGKGYDYDMELPLSGTVKPSAIAFSLYNIFVRLEHFTGRAYHTDPYLLARDQEFIAHHGGDMGTPSFKAAYEEMDSNTAIVEVMVDNVMEQMHFHVKKQWRVEKDAREELLWSVERGAVTEQVADFMDKSKEIAANMKHADRYRENVLFASLLESNIVLDKAFMVWTFVVNLAMIVTWVAPHELDSAIPVIQTPFTKHSDKDGNDDNAVVVMEIFGYIHLALTAIMVFAFFVTNPISLWHTKTTVNEQTHAQTGKTKAKQRNQEVDIIRELRAARFIQEGRDMIHLPLFSGTALYYMFLLASSILGVAFHGYTFAFCLLHITRGNDILSRVLSSVTQNGKSLLYVALLLVIVIYIYALAAFAYYREFYDREEGNFCYTMVQCFFTSLRLGLLSGGGLGDAFGYTEAVPSYSFHHSGMPAGRILFDISFFVLITTIGLNVVFGIIVDSFSELRDEKNKIEEKMTGECFICGLKSTDFDRFGNGWEHHIKKEHHMWDYLYLLRHLDEKDATEFTFLEQHVAQKLYRNENNFYPFGRSLVMPPGAPGGEPVGKQGTPGVNGVAESGETMMEKMMAMIQQQNETIASLHAKVNSGSLAANAGF